MLAKLCKQVCAGTLRWPRQLVVHLDRVSCVPGRAGLNERRWHAGGCWSAQETPNREDERDSTVPGIYHSTAGPRITFFAHTISIPSPIISLPSVTRSALGVTGIGGVAAEEAWMANNAHSM